MATSPPSTPSPSSSSSGRPGTWWWVGAVAAALVLAVAGYALGNSRGVSSTEDEYAEGQPKYEEIYNAGATAGTTVGEAAGQQKGEKTGRVEGVAAGEKAGFEKGEEAGKQEGLEEGQAEGRESGATAALGFSSWQTGVPYIVRVQQSQTADVPYTISTRTLMEEGEAYALCSGSTTQVCVKTESAPSGE
jgi:hypothetical protein